MGGSGMSKSVPTTTVSTVSEDTVETPTDDEETRALLEAARQREEERRRRQALATVATGAQGDTGTANVAKKTLG